MPSVVETGTVNESQAALLLRVGTELIGLLGLALVGFELGSGVLGWIFAVVLVVAAAGVWGVFRVRGDPGEAIVPVPGPVRLLLEIGLLGATIVLLWVTDQLILASLLLIVATAQYVTARARVRWLLTDLIPTENSRDPRA